jgi:hypothetical protein
MKTLHVSSQFYFYKLVWDDPQFPKMTSRRVCHELGRPTSTTKHVEARTFDVVVAINLERSGHTSYIDTFT